MPEFEGPADAPTAIDLFAGCGGMTYGLFIAGFNVKAAWEVDAAARYTYHHHHCQANDLTLYGDATDVDPSKVPDDLTLLAGGPSCQGYSSAGHVDPDDPRNENAFVTVEWVEACTPRLVLIENVVGMVEHQDALHSALVNELEDAGTGYTVQTLKLNSADYGVPQKRERLFIVGIRDGIPTPDQWTPPTTHRDDQRQLIEFSSGKSLQGYSTVREAFEDGGDGPLPLPLEAVSPANDSVHVTIEDMLAYRDDHNDDRRVDPHSFAKVIEQDGEEIWMPTNHVAADHNPETREKMAQWEHGFCGTSVTDRRLNPEEPAPTMSVSNGTPPVHYEGRSPENPNAPVEDVRRLTVREVARIQTFPDSHTFAGSKADQFRQAGNAVPPLLAAHVADHFRQVVDNPLVA